MRHGNGTPTQSEALVTALAIHRGIRFLAGFTPQSNVTQSQWAGYLESLFHAVQAELCADTGYCFSVAPESKGDTTRLNISGVFYDFARRFFDPNGFFATTDRQHQAQLLGEFAAALAQAARAYPYAGPSSLSLRVFFTAMGRLRGFMEKMGGIDFRRLSPLQAAIWQQPEQASAEAMAAMFLAAMDSRRTRQYPEDSTPYFYWPDKSVAILGYRFIQLQADDPAAAMDGGQPVAAEPLLVLMNGRLVPRSRFEPLLEQHLQSGAPLGRFAVPVGLTIGGLRYLGTDMNGQSVAEKPEIDFIDVREAIPPICMNLHPLTLLSHAQHRQLAEVMQRRWQLEIRALADPAVVARVSAGLQQSPELAVLVTLAAGRMQKIEMSLNAAIARELSAHQPVAKGEVPQLLMTMGGSGSGKGSHRYGHGGKAGVAVDYVVASLDEGRPHSDMYHVLIAAGHHADDYEAVHVWADTRRNRLYKAALAGRYHVFYDGSGVEYAGRYDRIVAEFSVAGYHTQVVATDCPLVVAPERRADYPQSAIDRIMRRAGYHPDGTPLENAKEAHYRTLPWRIAVNKHIQFPASFLAAFGDAHLDEIMLVDNAGLPGQDYVLAQSFPASATLLADLQKAQQSGQLKDALQQSGLWPSGSEALDSAAEPGFLATPRGEGYHLLVFNDTARLAGVMEKAQLNPNAHGPGNLTLIKRNASFILNSIDKPQGVTLVPPAVAARYQDAEPDSPQPHYLALSYGAS